VAKVTKIEAARRVVELIPLRLAGKSFQDIVQFAAERQWNVKHRQLRTYIRRCDTRLAADLEHDRQRMVNLHRVLRHHLYAQAMAAGDLRTALQALKDEATLMGIYAPKKYTNTDLSGDNPATPLSPQEVEALKAKLAARLSAPPAANGSTPELAKP
jgi:hypothetical protein